MKKKEHQSIVETNIIHNNNELNQFREVIQLFIKGKARIYDKIKVRSNFTEESIVIEKRKYRASLFMIHSMLKTMGGNEIAETLEISYDLLKKWNNEKTFKALMYSNYKEFLIYLGDLYM